MNWGVKSYVEKVRGCYEVRGTGTSIIEYWWADPDVKVHEEVHVGDYRRVWDDFIAASGQYTHEPMNKRQADCFKEVVDLQARFHRLKGDMIGDSFDCMDYGNQFGACDRVVQNIPIYSTLEARIAEEAKKCGKISGTCCPKPD